MNKYKNEYKYYSVQIPKKVFTKFLPFFPSRLNNFELQNEHMLHHASI